jgi:hypothetical protein
MNHLKMAIYMSRNMSWLKEYENKYILSIVANEGFIYKFCLNAYRKYLPSSYTSKVRRPNKGQFLSCVISHLNEIGSWWCEHDS